MQSPTALTPEPTDHNPSIESSSVSLESVTSFTEQHSISLTSSPLTVRSHEETPYKAGYATRKALHDILENISTTNNTPNKVITSNETLLRATPLLTPPSSEERPQPNFVSMDSFSSPLAQATMKQIPLTEKILAQSALYSRAIQKQQKHTVPASSTSTTKLDTSNLGEKLLNTAGQQAQQQQQQQHQHIPQFTYSQLQQQQQQQFFTRQLLNDNPEGHKDSPGNITREIHPATEPHSLTAVELPGGEITGLERHAIGSDGDAFKPIVTIPKPDPLENPLNTTNVYINGLPLRWTDDDLYRLTRGFGAVKSVKLFTRHLEDKPSAYGFVLFNCVEDAERFITTLRQHTQFHPSFAKTAKVPGTTNAKHAISDPVIPLPRDEDYADISITGLPLTIDMQTLRALFAPQVIKTSKFFHTAGTPRRLVGFIRLEGQTAAQDIIERLHGSNVLGWTEKLTVQPLGSGNDPAPSSASSLPSSISAFEQEQDPQPTQTIVEVPSTQSTPTQTPTIGVYQHQNVQMNDLSRLLTSMQFSATPQSMGQQDQSQMSPHHPKKQHDFQMRPVSQAPQSNHSPYTPTFDPGHPHNLSPAIENTPQTFYSSNNNNRLGLGIGMPSAASPLSETAYNTMSLHQILPTQDSPPMQQAQFQAAYGSTQQMLQALQAAVAAQDGIFANMDSGPSVNAFGARQLGRSQLETPWAVSGDDNLGPLSGGSPMHQLHRIHGGSFFDNTLRASGIPAQGTVGSNFYRPGLKFPPPLVSTTSVASVQASLDGPNKAAGAVPLLLPALAPSSPQGSSEESSPVTPTFPQVPRGIVSGHETEV